MVAKFNIGDEVIILEPFGDGVTAYPITSVMPINSLGELFVEPELTLLQKTIGLLSPIVKDIAYYQYEVDGVYYVEQHLEGTK